MKLLIIGNKGGTNIGESFFLAAQSLKIPTEMVLSSEAHHQSRFVNKIRKIFFDKIPANQEQLEQAIKNKIKSFAPNLVLVIGLTYLSRDFLSRIKNLKIKCAIFLTDDPWNQGFKSIHFLKSLDSYDAIFNPRLSNMEDLQSINSNTRYMPFAYCPYLLAKGEIRQVYAETLKYPYDIFFYGGADKDRVEIVLKLKKSGLKVLVAGGYWKRFLKNDQDVIPENLNPAEIKFAIQHSKLSLCLVRKANRDGHSMRTFELPYFHACMLVEDTMEHREIFGKDSDVVCYFNSIDDLIHKAKKLMYSSKKMKEMRSNCHYKVAVSERNTYTDRLNQILNSIL